MQRYKQLKTLGDGTYGSVVLGKAYDTGETVAIKKMKRKYYSWEECMNLREVKSLRKLSHTNLIKLKEVIRENDQLFFVFEYMKENLYQLMKNRDKLFPESAVRNIMYQILQGLAFMHKTGFFHRDMKPENLLCSGPELVKIADFGLVREIRSRPPYTDYVSTRWYRAPEVLLRSTNYSSPIDIFALGCIMAELYTLRPLFPGSSEVDMIFKICSVLGTPTKEEWPEGHQLAAAMNFKFPKMVATPLKQLIPHASVDGIKVIYDMLQWNPQKRPTAQSALRYAFFQVGQNMQRTKTQTQNQINKPISLPPKEYSFDKKPNANIDTNIKPFNFNQSLNKSKPQLGSFQSKIPVEEPKKPEPPKNQKSMTPRRRWGGNQQTKVGVKDSVDEFESILDGLGTSNSNMKTNKKPSAQRRERSNSISDKEKMLGGYQPLPGIGSAKPRNQQGTPGSAKDYYVQRSRYHPGGPNAPIKPAIQGRIVDAGTGKKIVELTSGNINESSSKRLLGDMNNRNYLPKIDKKDSQQKRERLVAGGTIWKPPAWNGNRNSSLTQITGGNRPSMALGRTDWSNKYGR